MINRKINLKIVHEVIRKYQMSAEYLCFDPEPGRVYHESYICFNDPLYVFALKYEMQPYVTDGADKDKLCVVRTDYARRYFTYYVEDGTLFIEIHEEACEHSSEKIKCIPRCFSELNKGDKIYYIDTCVPEKMTFTVSSVEKLDDGLVAITIEEDVRIRGCCLELDGSHDHTTTEDGEIWFANEKARDNWINTVATTE